MGKADHETGPKLNGLVETALFVENLPRACDFYEQVLGLRKIRLSDRGCVFRVANQRYLFLITLDAARSANETPYGTVPACAVPQREGPGPGHLAFGVSADALHSWRARLANYDIDILSEVTWEGGARSLYFRDPDGHLIELATAGIWETI
jgi:catechol 2,3-dioxygenase-like lactoylglutathione lyase family enzyme